MNSDEFVKKLIKAIPVMDQVLLAGYSFDMAKDTIEEETKMYTLLPKKCTEPCEIDDPVLHLIANYDTSLLEIGMIRLGKYETCSLPPDNKVLIGEFEADLLVINKDNGCIEVLDHAQPDYVMAKCAQSGGHFLEALLHVASYIPPYLDLHGTLSEEKQTENNNKSHDRARECAKLAGIINSPINIYEELLGCE